MNDGLSNSATVLPNRQSGGDVLAMAHPPKAWVPTTVLRNNLNRRHLLAVIVLTFVTLRGVGDLPEGGRQSSSVL